MTNPAGRMPRPEENVCAMRRPVRPALGRPGVTVRPYFFFASSFLMMSAHAASFFIAASSFLASFASFAFAM